MREKEKNYHPSRSSLTQGFRKETEWADFHETRGCTTFLLERLYQILSKWKKGKCKSQVEFCNICMKRVTIKILHYIRK